MNIKNLFNKTNNGNNIKRQIIQTPKEESKRYSCSSSDSLSSDREIYNISDRNMTVRDKSQQKQEIHVKQITNNYEDGKFMTIGLKLTKVSNQNKSQNLTVNSEDRFARISPNFEIIRIGDESDEEIVCLNDTDCYKSLDPNSKASYILEQRIMF